MNEGGEEVGQLASLGALGKRPCEHPSRHRKKVQHKAKSVRWICGRCGRRITEGGTTAAVKDRRGHAGIMVGKDVGKVGAGSTRGSSMGRCAGCGKSDLR